VAVLLRYNTIKVVNQCRLIDLGDHGDERKDEEGMMKYIIVLAHPYEL